jgi:hypothetical protein
MQVENVRFVELEISFVECLKILSLHTL